MGKFMSNDPVRELLMAMIQTRPQDDTTAAFAGGPGVGIQSVQPSPGR